jgi:hypothetical protein
VQAVVARNFRRVSIGFLDSLLLTACEVGESVLGVRASVVRCPGNSCPAPGRRGEFNGQHFLLTATCVQEVTHPQFCFVICRLKQRLEFVRLDFLFLVVQAGRLQMINNILH